MSTPNSRRNSNLPFVLESQLETLSTVTKKLDGILRDDPSLYQSILSHTGSPPSSNQQSENISSSDFLSLSAWEKVGDISLYSTDQSSSTLSFDPEAPLLDNHNGILSLDSSHSGINNDTRSGIPKSLENAISLYTQRENLVEKIETNIPKLESMISEMSETILNSDPSHSSFMTQKLLADSYSDLLSSCKIQLKKCNEMWENTINYCNLLGSGQQDPMEQKRSERLFQERRLIDDTSTSLNAILETTSASRRQLRSQNATFNNISSRFTRISGDLVPTIQRTMGSIRTRFQRNSLIMGALIATIILLIMYQQLS